MSISESAYLKIHRRIDGGGWLTDIVRGREGRVGLDSIYLAFGMAALHEGIEVGESAKPAASA